MLQANVTDKDLKIIKTVLSTNLSWCYRNVLSQIDCNCRFCIY